MFREKEICDAIRTAYLHLFPDKKERKRALSRLDLELVAQHFFILLSCFNANY